MKMGLISMAVKAQTGLHICTVSPEPFLFTHVKQDEASEQRVMSLALLKGDMCIENCLLGRKMVGFTVASYILRHQVMKFPTRNLHFEDSYPLKRCSC